MNFKELTKEPHIAGQRRDNELTKLIQKAWMDMSFDHVELAEFDFYLSFPNQVNSKWKSRFQTYLIQLRNVVVCTAYTRFIFSDKS